MIYLAGPIDGVSSNDAMQWRDHAAKRLRDAGLGVYNPATAFSVSPIHWKPAQAEFINFVNDAAVSRCDALLANLLFEGRMFGTIREIEAAKNRHIRVFAVAGEWAKHHMATIDLDVYDNLDSAINALLDAV